MGRKTLKVLFAEYVTKIKTYNKIAGVLKII